MGTTGPGRRVAPDRRPHASLGRGPAALQRRRAGLTEAAARQRRFRPCTRGSRRGQPTGPRRPGLMGRRPGPFISPISTALVSAAHRPVQGVGQRVPDPDRRVDIDPTAAPRHKRPIWTTRRRLGTRHAAEIPTRSIRRIGTAARPADGLASGSAIGCPGRSEGRRRAPDYRPAAGRRVTRVSPIWTAAERRACPIHGS